MINIREFLGLGYYVSELDGFLNDFDKNHPKLSASQQKEMDKYKRIFALRDTPQESIIHKTLWEKF